MENLQLLIQRIRDRVKPAVTSAIIVAMLATAKPTTKESISNSPYLLPLGKIPEGATGQLFTYFMVKPEFKDSIDGCVKTTYTFNGLIIESLDLISIKGRTHANIFVLSINENGNADLLEGPEYIDDLLRNLENEHGKENGQVFLDAIIDVAADNFCNIDISGTGGSLSEAAQSAYAASERTSA